ncbi:MAG TPA: acyl carrier protein [Gemmataceae bacterium]|nr:acyl carrier protein [Gemmataceae bacterium]
MTDSSETQNKVRQCISDLFLAEGESETLRNDTDLVGVLDSLQILRLVIELESLFAIKVRDSDLTLDNLGSVARIAAFIHRKRGAAERLDETLALGR